MTQKRSLLTLMLLACCAAGLLIWLLQQPEASPTPVGPGAPTLDDPAGSDSVAGGRTLPGDAVPAAANQLDPNGAPATLRNRIPDQRGDDDRVCEVLVEVRHEGDDAMAAAFRDVSLFAADTEIAQSRTNGAGRARFAIPGGHDLPVRATCGPGCSRRATLSADRPTTIAIHFEPRVRVQGRVVDASGIGVSGADIVLLRWPEHPDDRPRLSHVGRSGRRGEYLVYLRAGGRLGALHRDYAPSAMFLIRPRQDAGDPLPTQSHELTLLNQAASVIGSVCDHDGEPIANAVIELRNAHRAEQGADLAGPPRHAVTAADGSFAAGPLQPGALLWSARAEGYGWSDGQITAPAGKTSQLRIELPLAGTITGIAVDTDDRAIADATLTASSLDARQRVSARSAADGSFTLRGIGSGTVSLRASSGNRHAQARCELPARGNYHWRAVLRTESTASTLTGLLLDERDDPLVGWRIVVREPNQTPKRTKTNEQGAFAVTTKTGRDLDVRAYRPGRALTSFADSLQRGVTVGTEPLVLRTDAREAGQLRGRVVSSTYTGVAATIGIWHDQRREYARFSADPNGNFELPNIPPGDISLTIEHSGHSRHELQVTAPVGATADLGTVQLQQAGTLFGTIASTAGVAPTDCAISLLAKAAGGEPLRANYAAGAWRLPGAPAGQHTLLVEAAGFASESFAVTVRKGIEAEYNIELRPGLQRRLVLHLPAGAERNVRVALLRSDGGANGKAARIRWFATAPVLRDGQGQRGHATFLTTMAAGTYQLRAWTTSGYEARETVRYQFDGEPDVAVTLSR